MNGRRAKRIRKRRTGPPQQLDKKRFVTTTEFAKAAHVTPTTVRQAIKTGRLKGVLDGQWWRVDIKQLDDFAATLTRTTINATRGGNGKTKPEGDDAQGEEGINSFNAAVMERVFKARKARLEFQRAKEELIPAETVAHEWQVLAQGILSALLSIPDRVAPMMEGMKHREIHRTLTKEIKHACQAISDSIRPAD